MNQKLYAKEFRHLKTANVMAIIAPICLVLLSLVDYIIKQDDERILYTVLFIVVTTCVTMGLTSFLKTANTLGFYIPLNIFVCYIAYTGAVGGNPFFFTFAMCIYGICSLYYSFYAFIKLLLLTDAILILVYVMFGIRYLGSETRPLELGVGWVIFSVGTVLYTFTVYVSSSKNRNSTKAQDSFSTMLATTPNIIALVDNMNCVTFISKPLAKLARIEKSELAAGRPLIDLFHEPDLKVLISDTLDANGFYEETTEIKMNGESHWYKVISDKMSGHTIGRFIDISDVTPIMKAKAAAEYAAQAKSDFLAKMSHEIRTPMNAITGMTELILRNELEPHIREQSILIKQASNNLLSIINDILDFSKIESGKMEIVQSEFLFSSLMNDVISIIRTRTLEKPILFITNIDCKIPNKMVGDEVRLRQILLNLLSNAYKYCDSGFISLNVTGDFIAKPDSDNFNLINISFEVKDSGIGIKQEDVNKLFNEFTQIDQTINKGKEGTGLGLVITRNLCRAMGGDIIAASVYGEGSTFTANIPQKYAQYEQFACVENAEKIKVLVYESREIYSKSIISSLENLGINCSHVASQSQLFEKIEHDVYDYVFASSFLYDSTVATLEKSSNIKNTEICVLAEYATRIAENDVKILSMPAHAISIANLINNIEDNMNYNDDSYSVVRFTAPTAKILIVDDIITNLIVAEGLLIPFNSKIVTCTSGAEAVEKCKEIAFDIVFMDHMMPDMDGIEATNIIRKLAVFNCYYKTSPILALTANAVSGVKEMFLQNGFDDFISKPIDTSKLNSMMEHYIKKSKQEKYVGGGVKKAAKTIEIEDVDVKTGLGFSGGTEENYFKILAAFLTDGNHKVIQLKDCIATENFELYGINVHAIKSAAASIGAKKLSKFASELEQAINDKNISFVADNTEQFLNELGVLLVNIENAVSEYNLLNNKFEDVTFDDLTQDLIDLKAALEEVNTEVVDGITEKLESLSIEGELRKSIDTVMQNIMLCDYDEAVENIEKLIAEKNSIN